MSKRIECPACLSPRFRFTGSIAITREVDEAVRAGQGVVMHMNPDPEALEFDPSTLKIESVECLGCGCVYDEQTWARGWGVDDEGV